MSVKNNAPQGSARFLLKSRGIALWGYTLMLFIMWLPALAVRFNPPAAGSSMEALQTQSLVTFSPLFFALAAMITALFFAVVQNKYFVAAAIEQGKNAGKENMKHLMIPFLRWKEMLEIAGDFPFLKWIIASSAAFWLSYLILGLLSPFPVYFLLIAMLLFYAGARQRTNVRSGWFVSTWSWSLFIIFLLSSTTALQAMADKNFTAPDKTIPADRKALAQLIYQGKQPHREFSSIADNFMMLEQHSIHKLSDARLFYSFPASYKKEIKKIISDREVTELFAPIEKALDNNEFVKYDFKLEQPYLWYPGGKWYFNRVVCRYFCAGILTSLEAKDKNSAMLYFRRLNRFLENIQTGDYLMSLNYIFNQEVNRTFTIGAMLGSGQLSDADLKEIAAANRGREKKLRAAMLDAIRGEASFEQEFIRDMAKVYPWIQSSESSSGVLYENAILKFLLRGNNAFPPNTWNAVMLQNSLSESAQKFNKLLEVCAKKEEFKRQDVPFKGTYFAVMNYESQLVAIESLQYAITCVRLTDAALEVEKFRRANKRLPATLAELKSALPKDATTGKSFTYDPKVFQVKVYTSPETIGIVPRPGWQLSGSPADYINICVPAAWPVKTPPEFPKQKNKK